MFSVGDTVDLSINDIEATEGIVISTNDPESERYPLSVEFLDDGLPKIARLTPTGQLWVGDDKPCITLQNTVTFEL